jgi:hypothetical protein
VSVCLLGKGIHASLLPAFLTASELELTSLRNRVGIDPIANAYRSSIQADQELRCPTARLSLFNR